MMTAKRIIKAEEGNTLLIVLLLLLVLSAVGAGLLTIASVDVDIAGNQRAGEIALFNADAGIRDGLVQLVAQIDSGSITLTNAIAPVVGETDLTTDGVTPIGNSSYSVDGELAYNEKNQHVECLLAGEDLSKGAGRRRFHLISTGHLYPSGQPTGDPRRAFSSRTVEALVLAPREFGVCPPGLGGSYSD